MSAAECQSVFNTHHWITAERQELRRAHNESPFAPLLLSITRPSEYLHQY